MPIRSSLSMHVHAHPVLYKRLGVLLSVVIIFVLAWFSQGWAGYYTLFFPEKYDELPSGVGIVSVTNDEQEIPDTVFGREGNWIDIPRIGVSSQIYEGGEEAMEQGVWILPHTSKPVRGSNTVLSSHRWLYEPPDPRTFYNLDKLETDDVITVTWQGEEYHYRVREMKTVTPDQVEILGATKDPILTLFTCTPMYSTSHRLVVVADLITDEL
jgi:LPXTG-site transpeptidase (sortase) family protein